MRRYAAICTGVSLSATTTGASVQPFWSAPSLLTWPTIMIPLGSTTIGCCHPYSRRLAATLSIALCGIFLAFLEYGIMFSIGHQHTLRSFIRHTCFRLDLGSFGG